MSLCHVRNGMILPAFPTIAFSTPSYQLTLHERRMRSWEKHESSDYNTLRKPFKVTFLWFSFNLIQSHMKIFTQKSLQILYLKFMRTPFSSTQKWHIALLRILYVHVFNNSLHLITKVLYLKAYFSSTLKITVWVFCPCFPSLFSLHLVSVWSHQQIQIQLPSVC